MAARRAPWVAHIALGATITACAPQSSPQEMGRRAPVSAPPAAAPPAAASEASSGRASSTPTPAEPAAPPQLDPDGNDDDPPSDGVLPDVGHFERVGAPPLALRRICDLRVFGDALYAAHANVPLGSDGATVSRYRPSDAAKPWSVAFDWNRPGEPTQGGGAGQGFLRVRHIGTRLFVPDSDPPYLGFWMSHTGTEGFVYISNPDGSFARARMPGHLPPLAPKGDGAGAGVLPGAYHVLDVIRFRGHLYASTGSVPPGQKPNGDAAPGALLLANDDLSRWEFALGYPDPPLPGVWRLTFLVRFRDRLYAGIQDYAGKEPHDYVVFAPPRDARLVAPDHARAVSVTGSLGTGTLRWYADRGRLYWIAVTRRGIELLFTDDGDQWRPIPLPGDAGAPTDIVRMGKDLVVLTEWALLRLDGERTTVVASVTDKHSPFEVSEFFCSAPLAVFRGELYAGGQRGGALYKLVPGEAQRH